MLRNLSKIIPKNTRSFAVDGFGRVPIGNKSEKLVKNLNKGDTIITPYGPDTVREIIKFTPNGFSFVVEFNKMLITPNHPIKIYDEWSLPKEVKAVKTVQCGEMYDIKLEKYDVLTVNGNNIKV